MRGRIVRLEGEVLNALNLKSYLKRIEETSHQSVFSNKAEEFSTT